MARLTSSGKVLCAALGRSGQDAAIRVEKDKQIDFGSVAMRLQQAIECSRIPGADGTAKLRISGEHRAGSPQPGMATGRQLSGDAGRLVQDLVGALRDLPVAGQQYRADGAELGKDDEQSGQGQDF